MSEVLASTVSTSISHVCVYRSGAVITRSGTVQATALPAQFCIDGLPLSLEESSVRVRASGKSFASGVKAVFSFPPEGEVAEPELEAAIRKAEEDAAGLERSLLTLTAEQARRERIPLSLPTPVKDEPPRPAPAAAWTGLLSWLREAGLEAAAQRQKLNTELTAARERVARLKREFSETRKRESALADKVRKKVLFQLSGPAGETIEIQIEYRVSLARWVPSYVFRIFPKENRASVSLRALVTQSTGEAWEHVRLSVSTAEPLDVKSIPDLASLRIGRRQPPPASSGYREVPAGLEELFSSYDQMILKKPARIPAPEQARPVALALPHTELAKEKSIPEPIPIPPPSIQPSLVPPGAVAAPSQPAAPKLRSRSVPATPPEMEDAKPLRREAATLAASFKTASGAADESSPATDVQAAPEPQASLRPRDSNFGALILQGLTAAPGLRGRLRRMTLQDQLIPASFPKPVLDALQQKLSGAGAPLLTMDLPSGTRPIKESIVFFDYRYDSEAFVEVPCDGALHNVGLFEKSASVQFEIVTAPRESLEAFRAARIMNPLAVPLLAGGADVYLGDEFLLRTPLKTIPAGGEAVLGLGVEEAVKVARNTFFNETSHGLLGGGLSLVHRVEIEIASRLPAGIQLDVRERIPVLQDKEDQIELTSIEATPPWSPFDQAPGPIIKGGKRWRLTLDPGETKKLSYTYTVKIDSKLELAGGNRREA